MKKYILLRDNRESGPFSLEELRELNLTTKDLVWIESESISWLYPSEINDLKDFVSPEKKKRPGIYVSRPREASLQPRYDAVSEQTCSRQIVFEENEPAYVPATSEKGIWKSKKLTSFSNFLSVCALSCGLVLGAVMMKKAVDGSERLAVAEQVPLTVIPQLPAVPNSAPAQTALLTETVPPRLTMVKTAKAVKPKNIKEQVSIKASDYSVGVLGGISNLQLKLFNSSSRRLDRVTIAIQYLKPNGSVVETDQYEMYSIKPFSAATLAIPDSKRGVKIKYKVVGISSKETKEI